MVVVAHYDDRMKEYVSGFEVGWRSDSGVDFGVLICPAFCRVTSYNHDMISAFRGHSRCFGFAGLTLGH